MYGLRWSEKLAREAALEEGEAKGKDKLSHLISHLLAIP